MKGERITGRTPLGFEYIRDLPEVKDYRVQTPKYARALKWTTEPPTVEGWYWARTNKGHPYIARVGKFGIGQTKTLWVYVVGSDRAIDFDFVDHWLGPLPIPEPPKGE